MKEVIDGYTNEDLKFKIDNEGLEDFFIYYIGAAAINDEKLREQVNIFEAARTNLVKRLVELGVFDEGEF